MTTRIERLADALYEELVQWAEARRWSGTTRKEVPVDDVRRCFGAVYQRRESDGSIASMILDSLAVLIRDGLIEAVRADDSERIALPKKIRIMPTKAARTVPPMPRWHRLLYDLDAVWATATDKQRVRYKAINRWLMSDPDTTVVVPLRERTLEIFSKHGSEEDFDFPEKALDDMRSGPLFGDQERLIRLLRVVPTPPPLLSKQPLDEVAPNRFARVGDGDLLLVVENSATWWSIVKSMPEWHNVGHVAWGLGGGFMSSIRSIADNHEIRRIRYFGDIDLSGIRIPLSAQNAARALGLPDVLPAANLYGELFAIGRSWRAGDKPVDEALARRIVSWLPRAHREDAMKLLMKGRRIAQEWVGFRHLSLAGHWHADLM